MVLGHISKTQDVATRHFLFINWACLPISAMKAILGAKDEIRIITKNMNHFNNEFRSETVLNIPCFYENGAHAEVCYQC